MLSWANGKKNGNWKVGKKGKQKREEKKKNCNGIVKIIAIKTERAKNNEENNRK